MAVAHTMTTLRFYFDFISPYAYLGWGQAKALAERRGLELRPVPVLFAAMLNTHGNKGPAEIPPKRIYTFKHVVRLAHDLGVPLRPPPAHPFKPLLALRIASLPQPEQQRRGVIDLLFDRTWARGVGVTDPAALVEAFDQAGLPGAQLVQGAGSDEAKAGLRAQTEDAQARGVFGVPSMEPEGSDEVFWGQDAMPHLERFLLGEDPVSDSMLTRWRDLPSGAVRRS